MSWRNGAVSLYAWLALFLLWRPEFALIVSVYNRS